MSAMRGGGKQDLKTILGNPDVINGYILGVCRHLMSFLLRHSMPLFSLFSSDSIFINFALSGKLQCVYTIQNIVAIYRPHTTYLVSVRVRVASCLIKLKLIVSL